MPKIDGLTYKQLMFCQEYIVDLNGTQAAIRAGYSPDTAYVIASENLTKPKIKAKIDELMALRVERTEITANKVLVELAKIGFADTRKLFSPGGGLINPADLDDDIAPAVQQIEVVTSLSSEKDEFGNRIPEYTHKIRLADKKGALELMGKHLNLFTDRVELTGKGGNPLEINHAISTETLQLIDDLSENQPGDEIDKLIDIT